MITWKDYRISQLEQIEAEKRADMHRLGQLMITAQRPNGRMYKIYGPMMAKMGSLLLVWGEKLQSRYSEFAAEAKKRATQEIIRTEIDKILARS